MHMLSLKGMSLLAAPEGVDLTSLLWLVTDMPSASVLSAAQASGAWGTECGTRSRVATDGTPVSARDGHSDACSFSRCGSQIEGCANRFGSLAHVQEAPARDIPTLWISLSVEAASVVADRQIDR